jgi:MoaA/NifB/PqqE/SkfB family radical SAM enzyme
MKNINLEITGEVYYNLNNIYDVIVELGIGDFKIIELIKIIEKMFPDFSENEKNDLGMKIIKILKILN